MRTFLTCTAIATLSLAACSDGQASEVGQTPARAMAQNATPAADVTPDTRIISRDISGMALTIYPDDLALVTETRKVSVPAGRSTIAFEGVSDLIIPQSLILQAFTGISLERNFDYALLGKVSLFENSVGKTLRLTRIDENSGESLTQDAEIVSADARGGVVVRTEDGFEGLSCSGLKTRESFEGLPPGLAARPVMSVDVEAETAGEQEVTISYLTSGFDWAADYRLDLMEESSDLLGWLSLENRTAKLYPNVDLAVIAGRVQRDYETRGVELYPEYLQALCWPVGSTKTGISRERPEEMKVSRSNVAFAAPPPPMPVMAEMAADAESIVVTGSRIAKQEDFGDYKLYRIPETVTVAPYQTKQLAFLNEDTVAVEQVYALDIGEITDAVTPLSIRYDIDNDREGTLAKALPKGTVRVFAPSPTVGRAFVGEDEIEDIPVGLPAKVTAGRSVTIFSEAVFNNRDEEITLTLTNAGDTAAVVLLRELDYTQTRIDGVERDPDEDIPTWRVTVEPESQTELRIRRRN